MWGEFRLARAEAKPRRRSLMLASQQKSFLFLLEEKIGRAQNQKRRENFFTGCFYAVENGKTEKVCAD